MKKKIIIILITVLCLFSQAVSIYAADYEYDDLGRVTKVVYEDGSSVTYIYDAKGNIVTVLRESEWEDRESNRDLEVQDQGQGFDKGEKDINEKAEREMPIDGEDEREAPTDGEDEREALIDGEDKGETPTDGEGKSNNAEDVKPGGNFYETSEGKIGEKENEESWLRSIIAGIIVAMGIVILLLIKRSKKDNSNMVGIDRADKSDKKTEENGREGKKE